MRERIDEREKELMEECDKELVNEMVDWLFGYNGISTFVGYL